MTLAAGTRLGSFEIGGRIGAGGMGEVYRATDSKLGRDVAIKTLPASLAEDPDRLARFEREAKLLASLNHAHIASVHSLDEHDGTIYIAMELVDGETLESRLKSGPLPIEDSLQIALQIASALEAAHEKGVVHRDLKPANVMLTPDGVVKVLDFGLAKAFSGDPTEASPGHSPALSMAMTQQGLILGTAGYMSPEQASGQGTDQRADIWAFGVVLYEMLTGQPLFSGETVPHILAGVLRLEPDWNRLPGGLHRRLKRVLERCLKKKPRDRYHSIADVRIDIDEILSDPDGAESGAARPAAVVRRSGIGRLGAAVAVTALIMAGAGWALWPREAARSLSRFDYDVPAGVAFRYTGRPVFAASRDGRQFLLNANGGFLRRRLEDLEARVIPGTQDDMTNPFFSPDGQSIAYFSGNDGLLKRIPVAGGASVTIAADIDNPYGASWERDGTILIGQNDGIYRVSADGGTPELVIPAEAGERMHGPQLLPGGESVLVSIADATNWDTAAIVAVTLATGERTVIVRGGSDARYVPTGHIVYAFEDSLFSVPFDLGTLEATGGPQPLLQGLSRAAGGLTASANYEISEDGTLFRLTGGTLIAGNLVLTWVDRAGNEADIGLPSCICIDLALSPDETRVAIMDVETERGESDIFIWSFDAMTRTRLTFEAGFEWNPVWTADSQQLVYAADNGIYGRAADGTGTIRTLLEPGGFDVFAIDTEDRLLIEGGPGEIRALAMSGDAMPEPVLSSEFQQSRAALSPDRRWLAYESNETGTFEIYVRPYPDVDSGKWQVSEGGGTEAEWSPDGSSIFYFGPTQLMEAQVEFEPAFRRRTPRALFAHAVYLKNDTNTYAVAADGERFLMIRQGTTELSGPTGGQVIIEQNWTEELKRLVPTN